MDKILIVEDNIELADGLRWNLQKEDFSAVVANSLSEARNMLADEFDLCLLDLNLPDGDGFTFCCYLCEYTKIPSILLTVRDSDQDMVQGLSIGADDYITKPFKMNVLVSRIKAVLRRTRNQQIPHDRIFCGDICITKSASTVSKRGSLLELTPSEFQLLLLLMEHKNQTLTREQLLQRLWDIDGNYVNDNTLTTLMKRLRHKIEDHPQLPNMLLTVRGFGYKAVDYES